MTSPTLSVRLSRRAVGVAVFGPDDVTFADGRHLRSDRTAALRGMVRYLTRLLEQTQPRRVILDCPRHLGSTTAALWAELQPLLQQARVELHEVAVRDVLAAFGRPALRSRQELRRLTEPWFAGLSHVQGQVKPYVVDAAAAGLYAEAALSA